MAAAGPQGPVRSVRYSLPDGSPVRRFAGPFASDTQRNIMLIRKVFSAAARYTEKTCFHLLKARFKVQFICFSCTVYLAFIWWKRNISFIEFNNPCCFFLSNQLRIFMGILKFNGSFCLTTAIMPSSGPVTAGPSASSPWYRRSWSCRPSPVAGDKSLEQSPGRSLLFSSRHRSVFSCSHCDFRSCCAALLSYMFCPMRSFKKR